MLPRSDSFRFVLRSRCDFLRHVACIRILLSACKRVTTSLAAVSPDAGGYRGRLCNNRLSATSYIKQMLTEQQTNTSTGWQHHKHID